MKMFKRLNVPLRRVIDEEAKKATATGRLEKSRAFFERCRGDNTERKELANGVNPDRGAGSW
jgi:hypothetical protein